MAPEARARPRVLHVLEALGGGTSRHLVDVVRHVGSVEHVVAIPRSRVGWLSDDSAVDTLRRLGAGVEVVEMRRFPGHPRNAAALLRLRRLLRDVRPDIVHAHSSVAGALVRVAAVGTGVPVVYTPHAVATSPAALAVERALAPLTTRLVAVSASEGELAVRRNMVRRERLVVIPNGVDLDEPVDAGSGLREALGVPPGAILVGTLSRLVAQKAPLRFVEACATAARGLPGTHFLLAGDGVLLARVTRAIAEGGMGDRFHHLRAFDNPRGILPQLDVFVSASEFEGGPYTPLDAMLAGVPVVLTDVVGNRDIVENEVSGLLPAPNPQALAAAITRLVRDPGLRRRLAEAGARRVREHFDVRQSAVSLSELYASLLR